MDKESVDNAALTKHHAKPEDHAVGKEAQMARPKPLSQ